MALTEKKVAVHLLQVGMFVSRLDRPWEETGFPLQGLFIKSVEDIELLSSYCRYVYVDELRSHPIVSQTRQSTPRRAEDKHQDTPAKTATAPDVTDMWKRRHCVEHYQTTTPFEQEVQVAGPLLENLRNQVAFTLENLHRLRRRDLANLEEVVADVVESVVRNPDALAWLSLIEKAKKPVYLHTLRLAVWGCITGRQLGLNRFSLLHLTMTLVATGLGKSRIDSSLLRQVEGEFHPAAYREHLTDTIYYLKQSRFYGEDILNSIKNYCERFDGSGYPLGKKGTSIPFMSRLAGLIDSFEYMVHPFDPTKAISPANAVARLNKMKGKLFDPSLVEAFVQAIGIYPTGSLVELNSGVKGVVFSQTREKRIQAAVVPLVNQDGSRVSEFRIVNPGEQSDKEGSDQFIRRGLPVSDVDQQLLREVHNWMFAPKRSFLSRIFPSA